jgi:hypothetical protein
MWDVLPQLVLGDTFKDKISSLKSLPEIIDINKLKPNNCFIELLNNQTITDNHITEIYKFLARYYNNSGRLLVYSKTILSFYISFYKSYIVILRDLNKQIIGCIVGSLRNIVINNKNLLVWYVNFLCVDNNYRKNKLAAFLIVKLWSFITSMTDIDNIYNVYGMFHNHSSLNIPKAFSKVDLYIRPINIEKLINGKQIELPHDTLQKKKFVNDLLETYNVYQDNNIILKNFKLSIINTPECADSLTNLINSYRKHVFDIYYVSTSQEISKIILNDSDFICFVYKDKNNNIVAYMEIMLLKEIKNKVFIIGKINNYAYKKTFFQQIKNTFINEIIEYLSKNNIVDIIEIPEQLITNNKLLKKQCIKTATYDIHLFNHSIYKINPNKNGIIGF